MTTAITMLRSVLHWPRRLAIGILIGAIRIYQLTLSPLLGPACRFEPTCSRYMVEALRKYGLFKGLAKGLYRLARCNPWSPGGHDPP
ncbi:MAG: membrane protein insertion efficiency factor YidD [Isosphaeraceae bacterium]